MCYDETAVPPHPPVRRIRGGAANTGDTTLTASDGNRLMAHFARASKPTGAGMVVLPDVRGLHDFYKQLAARFADAGIDAVAVDYFGRTAGDGSRDEAFDFMSHVRQTTPEGVDADAKAGIDFLRSDEGGAVKTVFTVGFCFGGSNSWRQSATNPVDGAIGFYGGPSRARDYIAQMKAPLLLLIAGEDHTPREEFVKFDGDLTSAGVPHRMRIFEGAPHSFFDRTFESHKAACDEAWELMLDFVKTPPA